MAKDLEYYLAQARRIAAHREEGAEEAIRKEFKKLLKELKAYIGEVHEKYAAADGTLSFADLQKAGYDARFLEEIERRIGVATPRVAKELHKLVNETYELSYKSMVEGVEKVAKGADLGETFSDAVAITPEQIKAAVSNPYMENALLRNHQSIVYDIRQAVAVGLMNGDRYTTIANKITVALDKENGPYKNAVLIARTEAHRVREAGNNDAAVSVDTELQKGTSGMRMCKTWKTMKDERVRPQRRRKGKGGWSSKMGKGANHMKLEGQTVLASDLFDLLDHNTAPAPGSSGVAAHDCNCRCYASFAMLTDAEFFALTGKHFPGYKGETAKKQEAVEPAPKYNKDYDCEIAKKFGTDHYDKMHDMVAACTNQKAAAVWKKYESQIGVANANYRGGAKAIGKEVYLDIDDVAKGNSYEKPYQTAFHECGHAIDSLARKSVKNSNAHWGASHYSSAYKDGLFPQTIKDEVQELVKAKDKELKALFKEHAAAGDAKWFYDHKYISKWDYERLERGSTKAEWIIPKYAKSYAYSAVKKEVKAVGSKYAYGDLSDILEGATLGKIECGIGHGKTYWKDRTYDGLADGLATEAFAEMIDSTFACAESLEMIKKYLPKSYELFLEMLENLIQ